MNCLSPEKIVVFATRIPTQYPNPHKHKGWRLKRDATQKLHPSQPAEVYISLDCEDAAKMIANDGKLVFVVGMRGNMPIVMYQQILKGIEADLYPSDFKSLIES